MPPSDGAQDHLEPSDTSPSCRLVHVVRPRETTVHERMRVQVRFAKRPRQGASERRRAGEVTPGRFWARCQRTLVSAAVHPSGSQPFSLPRRRSYRSAVAVTVPSVPASTTAVVSSSSSSSSPPPSTPSSTSISSCTSSQTSRRPKSVLVPGVHAGLWVGDGRNAYSSRQ